MLILERKDIAKSAKNKPLKDLTQTDTVAGTLQKIHLSRVVVICESGKCKILKDAYSIVLGLRADEDGLYNEEAVRLVATNHPAN